MKSPRLTEHDLAIFEANMRKIKVGGSAGIGGEAAMPVTRPTDPNLREPYTRPRLKVGSNPAPSPSFKVGQPGPARAGADSQGAGIRSQVLPVTASPYRSKWEAAYASKLELEKAAGLIKQWWYEPFSLWLPGKVRYKPDFLIEMPYIPGMERHLEIIEVKGWSKNLRDGKTRLKIAAALFPCFVWRMVYRTKGGGWDGLYL